MIWESKKKRAEREARFKELVNLVISQEELLVVLFRRHDELFRTVSILMPDLPEIRACLTRVSCYTEQAEAMYAEADRQAKNLREIFGLP